MRSSGSLLQSRRTLLEVALDELVTGLAAHPETGAQLGE
jgi:hypothetical protein